MVFWASVLLELSDNHHMGEISFLQLCRDLSKLGDDVDGFAC